MNRIEHAIQQKNRVQEFLKSPRVTRGQLASILGVRWVRVNQILPRFKTEEEDGEVLIILSSVADYYANREKILRERDKRQMSLPLPLQPRPVERQSIAKVQPPARPAARPRKRK